jgi:hypothetical protein
VWTFSQLGHLYAPGGALVTECYSGYGAGKNNPELEQVRDMGPIPRGFWRVVGRPYTSKALGPYVLELEPEHGTLTFSRTEFRINGDAKARPGTASHGCIVLPR